MKITKKCWQETHDYCETKITKYCCRKMKQIFNPKWKKTYSDGSGSWYNSVKIDNGKLKICVREGEYGCSHSEYISFCPFCGESVE